MNVRLRDITDDDLPRIRRWLILDHVRNAWGDPDPIIRMLREPPPPGNWRAVIEADGQGIGIVLWQHPTREELDSVCLSDVPTSVIDIDIMIGEIDALGRGAGSAAVGIVAQIAFSDPGVPLLIACTRSDNIASQRAFAKAGFSKDREFDDVSNERYALMILRRPAD